MKRVEPVLPPDIVTANPGAVLAADVVVRANGTVESVTIVTAPPGLETPLTAALQQWTFQPFLVNGRPVRAVVMIDVALADPRADAERRSSQAYESGRLACEAALGTGTPNPDVPCGRLAALSDALRPERQLERVHAFQLHGVALARVGRAAEALTRFEQAIALRQRVGGNPDADADMGTLYLMAGQAQVLLNRLPQADALYERAIATIERAMAASPEMRGLYTTALANGFRLRAELKRATGNAAEAAALEARAGSAPPADRDTPLPPMRQSQGTVLLGPLGPALTDDDVSQLRALLPSGKRAWVMVANTGFKNGGEFVGVEVYLDPDAAGPMARSGRIIAAEASRPTGTPMTAKKSWARWRESRWVQVPIPGRNPDEIWGHGDVNRPTEIGDTAGEPLTIDEAADIVRTLRAAAKATSAARTPVGRGAVYVEVQPWTIESVMRWNGDVQAQIAENETLAGPGQWITLKKNGGRWDVDTIQPVGATGR